MILGNSVGISTSLYQWDKEIVMLAKFQTPHKVVGVKQCRKAIEDGRAAQCCIACDADAEIQKLFLQLCRSQTVPVCQEYTREQLGHACGIDVKAAVVVLLHEPKGPGQ